MSSRTRKVLAHGQGREIEYVALTARAVNGGSLQNEVSFAADSENFERTMDTWLTSDTAMVISNNSLRAFPLKIREQIQQFPVIYVCAGQMAFMLQDSLVLKDRKYVEEFKAMAIMSFSEGDINFQRQLGIHGQVKGFAPVEQRAVNEFSPGKNTRLGYVGRIDFHAKDSEKLIDIARQLKGSHWGAIKVFTTDGKNSPDYTAFRSLVTAEGLDDQFEIVLNERSPDVMFSDLAVLLAPSKKESFGNAVAEALSYGVPVIAASYAPGPAEILEDGISGFLLDEYTGPNVASTLATLSPEVLVRISNKAFERHKRYTVEAHIEQLERIASDAVERFAGSNVLRVFPKLRILEE
ncbi:glycosyltransferase family 4 protein [Nesterenkonia sp. Act20]|uniref:glycosyltransferase family 4 protein n=1 Tax=Nesterenkonia sp. Act20 TaxID=1483432 RepID=UPI001C488EEF|nr:glycosyltransferase family 4 protein [Nesterenkonia sp. Act20]